MTTKPAPGEVLFHITDDTEYATLHADDFRKGMLDRDHAIADLTRERDELRAAIEQTWRPEVKALRARNDGLRRRLEWHEAMTREVERLTLADRQWADHVKRLSEENERLRAALEGVLAEADRKTDAFDRAHAALERPN